MSYLRVIPRDLFNEANLLKCYGQLALLHLENQLPGFAIEHNGDAFQIEQNENSGDTYIINVELSTCNGIVDLWRPVNSREPWPLYTMNYDGDLIAVFDERGNPTREFLALGEPL